MKSRKNSCTKTILGIFRLALVLLGLGLFSTANAAVITEPFATSGSLQDWKAVGTVSGGVPGTPYTEVKEISSGTYGLFMGRRPDGAADPGALFYYGTAGDNGTPRLIDFSASFTMNIRMGQNSTFGFMVRATSDAFNNNGGYFVAYHRLNGVASLTIYDKPKSNTDHGAVLKTVSLMLDFETDYVFKVSAIGNLIEASIWSADGQEQLGIVSIDDARTTGGYFGFRAAAGGSNNIVTFRDLTVNTIPEPTTAALALIALAVGVAGRAIIR